MQMELGQKNFLDTLVKSLNKSLSQMDEMMDWSKIEETLSGIYGSSKGRPSYPLLTLFKALMLQQWYSLSDPGLEEALSDRISFRRFCGLSLIDPVPDHSTISRFRSRLGDRYERLLEALNAQLEDYEIIVKEGTMIDATFIHSATNKKEVDPEAANFAGQSKDRVTGYKAHAAVDKGSGIVRKVIVTPANVNDTVPADELVMGDEGAVYADKAYDKHSRREELEERGIFAGIMHRPNKYHPLTKAQVGFNKIISKIRAPVERTFAILKVHYNLRRTRYIGLRPAAVQITLAIMAMNIK